MTGLWRDIRFGFRLLGKNKAFATVAILTLALMQSQLHGIGTLDPASFSAVSIVMVFAALLACYIPARRATQVSPLVALRNG